MQYATGAQLANYGLQIRSDVEESVRTFFGRCVECNEAEAPPGLDSKLELAEWARVRAIGAPAEPLSARDRAWAFPGSRHTECPVCNAQLDATIGIPVSLLDDFMRGLDDFWGVRIRAFLETRFVFLFCQHCGSSPNESSVPLKTIAERYHAVRAALAAHNFDVTPAYANAAADRVFQRLALVIAERDRRAG